MSYTLFTDEATNDSYSVAILIKESTFDKDSIKRHYVNPLPECIDRGSVIAYSLPYNKLAISASYAKLEATKMIKLLDAQKVSYIYVADATYFKAFTGLTKAKPNLGYLLKCGIAGYEHINVVYGISYGSLIHNERNFEDLSLSMFTLASALTNSYSKIGKDLFGDVELNTDNDYSKLHSHPMLAADIETTGLNPFESKLWTIAFAWNEHDGKVFDIRGDKTALKEFLTTYKGKLLFHNATFDIKHLVYHLWMKHDLDIEGMLDGLDVFRNKFEDSQGIAFVATNNCNENVLSLKDLAHEFAGNYAVDVKDITKIPFDALLEYNLIDVLATNYVWNKYLPIATKDNQMDFYENMYKPSIMTIMQMELVGLPMDNDVLNKLSEDFTKYNDDLQKELLSYPEVITTLKSIRKELVDAHNLKLKTVQHPDTHYDHIEFNSASPNHVAKLLYETLGLEVLNRTKTGNPSTDNDTLTLLRARYPDIEVLRCLMDIQSLEKILGTYIPAFLKGTLKADGRKYLHGSYRFGVLSGRLSSVNPNMQAIPSTSKHASRVKECFVSPPGFLLVGADFSSLEDKINALVTKDPNKLKVYTENYDSHSFRAYNYWKDKMPDIDGTSVESINSIKYKYPELRSESKAPTFALIFGGTDYTLQKQCGFSKEEALSIQANFHEMYKVSVDWVKSKIHDVTIKGYADLAFGLRLRSKLLSNVVLNNRATVKGAEAEARTIGNAMSGQSYGLLNNRASNALMKKVYASKYRLDILPVSWIHDAQYYLVRDDIDTLIWFNNNLIKEMSWQELPEIKSEEVLLSAELDVFYKSMATPITIPNNADKNTIIKVITEGMGKYENVY